MRTTFENLARKLDVRLTRIEAIDLGPATPIFRDAAGFRCVSLVLDQAEGAPGFLSIPSAPGALRILLLDLD
jgi:hypothetical protein